MKGTLAGAIMFASMAAWTMFSDIFEYITQTPIVIPYIGCFTTYGCDYSFVIIWTDYEIITQIAIVCEMVLALFCFFEWRKGRTTTVRYNPVWGGDSK